MGENHVASLARKAMQASLSLASLSEDTRNAALEAMASAMQKHREDILVENARDIEAAQALVEQGQISAAAAKRLQMGGSKFDGVVDGLRSVASLDDPLGRTLLATELDDGLTLKRVSCPIGVISMIFESRPDALPQIASLCLKSGNAVLLKGGSEALHSNRALTRVLDEAARSVDGVPQGWITLLETREDIAEILKLDQYVDLIIPRGSNQFVKYIMDNTQIPVTGHRDGICHTYLHDGADPKKAIRITVDGKCQYPAVCNATETLLIDTAAASDLLIDSARELASLGVDLHLCQASYKILSDSNDPVFENRLYQATQDSWSTEYLDMAISVKLVNGINDAIDHINKYGSHHTDCIVTEEPEAAEKFFAEVDSSSVLHNASTRFADGFRYGLGAEVGISTEKIHSRGPVGLDGLTIYKYQLRGEGQIVADYGGEHGRKFTHKSLPVD